jgi:DNA polymerase III delta prime subunit
MEKPFLTKYRPNYFKDYIINKNIIDTIKIFFEINSINLLLIGNHCTGKTTILNTIINEYYFNIDQQLINDNLLHINNLQEQGISYYRQEVKTFCQTPSSIPNKKKTIILDDIDIINEQSQQVFRNCIDKYQHNVNFISSCSNIQKVIDSIQSRNHIIKIKPITSKYMKKIFNNICKNENLIIDNKTTKFILAISNNSIRIMINYLEKIKLINKPININLALDICSNIRFDILEKYTTFCLNKNLTKAVLLIYNIYNNGYSVTDILDNYFLYLKNTDILCENKKYRLIKIICKYIVIFNTKHENEIELALMTNNIINILNNSVDN